MSAAAVNGRGPAAPPAPAPVPLVAEAVSYRAGGLALVDGVSLEVRGGEVLALVGPNGAGKSTLLALLAGDLRPAAGRVLLAGRPVGAYHPAELARLRAVMPQQSVLQFAYTAREVVTMGRAPHARGGRPGDDERAVAEAMRATAVDHLAERAFQTLSGGEQTRATLARVLAQGTGVLLLDEPTAALDIGHQAGVMALARDLAGEGHAVVAVLHDLNLAAASADRVALLAAGRLVATGPPGTVLTGETLSEVFGCEVVTVPHPFRDCPVILTAP